jgi:hypothetical protein
MVQHFGRYDKMLPLSRNFKKKQMVKSTSRVSALIFNLLLLPIPAFSAPILRPITKSCVSDSQNRCPPLSPVELGTSRWKLARVNGPRGGETYVSIMKTADTIRSDPDFAGLMIRCAAAGKIDVLIVLIQPFPPQSHPQVTIRSGSSFQVLKGAMTAAGAAVVLPDEAALLAQGPWQTLPSLSVSVKENQSEIKGIVILDGLREAYDLLTSSCAQ